MKYGPYSFSKINTFFNCQKQFEYTYILKTEIDTNYETPTYFKRGRFIHQYIANRLNGGDGFIKKYVDIPVEEKLVLTEAADIILNNEYITLSYDFEITSVEQTINLDINLNPIGVKDAFTGSIDYFAIQDDLAIIVDWKSGKYRENPRYDQLELYSIWIASRYKGVKEVDLVFSYIEHNVLSVKTIQIDEIIDFKNKLKEKIDTIENTNIFELNVSKQCYSCPYFKHCSDEFGIII